MDTLGKKDRERLANEEWQRVLKKSVALEEERMEMLKKAGKIHGLDGEKKYFNDIDEWTNKELKRIREKYRA